MNKYKLINPHSLAARFVLWFVLIGLLPLITYGYFSYQHNQDNIRAQIIASLSAIADKKSSQIKIFLRERSKDALLLTEGLSHYPLTQLHLSEAENAELKTQLRQFISPYVGAKNEAHFYDALLVDLQGNVLFSFSNDQQSNVTQSSQLNSNLHQTFRLTQETLTSYISDVELNAQKIPTLYVSQPIFQQGKLFGVAIYQMRQNRLFQIANDRTGLGKTGETPLAKRIDDKTILFLNSAVHGSQQFVAEFGVSTPMKFAIQGQRGSGVGVDYRGVPVLAAWRYLPELRLGMVVKINQEEAFMPLYAQRNHLLVILALVTLIGGSIAWLLGRRHVQRVNALLTSVQRMNDGNWSNTIQDMGQDELGVLARSFNEMSLHLQAMQYAQQQLIEERTGQLQFANETLKQRIAESEADQQKILSQQALFSEAQRLGRLGCWELNLQTNELTWSDEIYNIFELNPKLFQPSYENFLNVIHPDDRDKVNLAYQSSLQARQTYDIEHRLLMADGRIKWVREHCTHHYDYLGQAICSVGAVQDITHQKEDEARLRVVAVSMEMRDSIVIANHRGQILQVNRAFYSMFGFSEAEVLGQNPRILSSGRHNRTFYRQLWEQLLKSGSWQGEIWNKRKNGEIFPCRLVITVVRGDNGEISNFVATHSDITEQKRNEAEIRHLAFYDALTELPNRRLLLDRLRMAIFNAQRSRKLGAVLFLDMDKFKMLNDTQGHEYGDLMLNEVAQRIKGCVRETDTVARFGGDEFVVLLEEVGLHMEESVEVVRNVAEKIRSSLTQPYLLNHYTCHSSPSIGICMFKGDDDVADVLLKHADMAMYQVKNHGRNGVRFFDPIMKTDLEAKALLENDLRDAINKQQFQLYYQLQVDGDGKAIGAEILLRWMHPQKGMISPLQFIPAAEESNLILEISDWVLAQACMQLARWQSVAALQDFKLSVNISAKTFYQESFVERVLDILNQYGVSPKLIILELTESVVLDDIDSVIEKMQELKKHGISLSLDDFGTGYSSLSYIKKLPIDQLKIDRSFVSDICVDRNSQLMIKAILDLANNFQLETIAEGVEETEQHQQLHEWGCDLFQGYLFSKPVPLSQMEALLQRNFFAR